VRLQRRGAGLALLIAIQALLIWFALAGVARATSSHQEVLDVIRAQPRYWNERNKESARDLDRRRVEIARAIAQAAENPSERALLIAVGYHESRWARYVHLDEPSCRNGPACDNGKSYGPWQSQRTGRGLTTLESARAALAHLLESARACGGRGEDRVRRAVSLYATGASCTWKGAEARLVTWRWAYGRLTERMAAP
jgi:hypothetical protein